jgi:hypothetical protein
MTLQLALSIYIYWTGNNPFILEMRKATLNISFDLSFRRYIHVKYYSRYTIWFISLIVSIFLSFITYLLRKTNDEDNPINVSQLSISCILMSRILNWRRRKKVNWKFICMFKMSKIHRFEWINFQLSCALSVSYFKEKNDKICI